MNTKRVTFLSIILANLIVLKYALGFLPGIELVTFVFVVVSLFITIKEAIVLVTSFFLIVNLIYGFNLVFVPYLPIYFLTIVISKLIFGLTKNKITWVLIGSSLPILVTISYFVYDSIIWDFNFALLNIVTAIPIFLISAVATFTLLALTSDSLIKILNNHLSKRVKFESNNFNKVFVSLVAIVGTIGSLAAIRVGNDYVNGQKYDPKQPSTRLYSVDETNQIIDTLQDDESLFVFIFNQDNLDDGKPNKYTFKVDGVTSFNSVEAVLRDVALNNSEWNFNFKQFAGLGEIATNFYYQGKWYGKENYCGYIFINGNLSSLGASSIRPKAKHIYSFDYHYKDNSYNQYYCRIN